MDESKGLEYLLKPIPFNHGETEFFIACAINDKRGNGIKCCYNKILNLRPKKSSEVVEFIENSLDLTKREQLVLAFIMGQEHRK